MEASAKYLKCVHNKLYTPDRYGVRPSMKSAGDVVSTFGFLCGLRGHIYVYTRGLKGHPSGMG